MGVFAHFRAGNALNGLLFDYNQLDINKLGIFTTFLQLFDGLGLWFATLP
jgi:hypothetical protein